MPLKVPDLDDRTYSDLVTEALSMIPRFAPTWTNHNPSDPGITLIELLAYFTEMMLYRLNRVSRENKIKFLQLLLGAEVSETEQINDLSLEEVEKRLQETIVNLKCPQRAVTSDDYIRLVKQAVGENNSIRVHCCHGKNLETDEVSIDINRPGHTSIIVVLDDQDKPDIYEQLIEKIINYLEPKRLLTTRLHVVQPYYVWFSLNATIQPGSGMLWDQVHQAAADELKQFFSPFKGPGSNCHGWPFGRNLYLSEIYNVLETVTGVDYVADISIRRLSLDCKTLGEDRSKIGLQIGIYSTVGIDSRLGTKHSVIDNRLITDGSGNLIGINLKSYELPRVVLQPGDLVELGSSSPKKLRGGQNG